MKQKTLIFLTRPDEELVLLAMKKRGFGMDKWNGVGGKVEAGETIPAAAVREAREEIGVHLREEDLMPRGVISFSFDGQPELTQDVHVFFAERWEGAPVESEEMRPAWYPVAAIPYDEMWIDDRYWLPITLAGASITARFHFSATGDAILESDIVRHS